MKCNYCNTELKQGAKFCPNCGKEVLEYEVCISCGEKIKIGVQFCPHCGANQAETIEPIQQSNTSVEEQLTQKDDVPIQNEEVPTANESRDEHVKTQQLDDTVEVQNNSSKKWLLIIPLIILIVGAGAGYYFFNKSSGNDSVAVSETIETDADSDEKELDIHSVEGIKARLNDIFTEAFSMSDDVAVKKYFTKEYQELFSKVEEYDKNNVPEGALGFWDESIWGDGQGDLGKFHHETRTVNMTSEQKASALVDYISDEFKGVKQPVKIDLCFENGNWFIDDISNNDAYGYKEAMKKYIKEFAQGSYSSSSFENKIYKGNGNGGGLYTEMTISFFGDNQCNCASDWYQAYSSPKTLKGQYEIKNNMVVVKCKDGDTEHLFEFEISSNGRILKFDHSDPDMGGTMGNDYMSLEVQ